jgi:hypothetical protein
MEVRFSAFIDLWEVAFSNPLRLSAWDLEFDGIAVELDEHLHFNRYRGLTLKSPRYSWYRVFLSRNMHSIVPSSRTPASALGPTPADGQMKAAANSSAPELNPAI